MVLDASAAIDYVTRASGRWESIAERIEAVAFLHAPDLFGLEVIQGLRRVERAGVLSELRLLDCLTALAELRVVYHDHAPLLRRVWSLRRNLTAYDAAYVALAEALDAPLLTSDARLARTAGHNATIDLAPR